MRVHSYVVAILFLFSLAAHADTVFNLQGTFASGGSLSGTISLNSASTAFSGIHATVVSNGSTYNFSSIATQQSNSADYLILSAIATSSGFLQELGLYLPQTTLAAFRGTAFCVSSSLCGAGNVSEFDISVPSTNLPVTRDLLTSGGIVSASTGIAPEPSSLVLLGTGLVASTSLMRRRIISS